MVKVTLDGVVLAESNDTIVVEGNHYFPPADVRKSEYFSDSNTRYIISDLSAIHQELTLVEKLYLSLERVRSV